MSGELRVTKMLSREGLAVGDKAGVKSLWGFAELHSGSLLPCNITPIF
jgi:hypothetical protein